jgi:hypothetical protein
VAAGDVDHAAAFGEPRRTIRVFSRGACEPQRLDVRHRTEKRHSMGDKSPKAKDKNKKQDSAQKQQAQATADQKKAASAVPKKTK